MDPEQQGGGSFLSQRFLGMPVILWILILALAAYFLFFRNSGAVPPTTGGGGGAATESTTLQKGAVTINIESGDTDQPKPPVKHKRVEHHRHISPPRNPPPTAHRKREPPKKSWQSNT